MDDRFESGRTIGAYRIVRPLGSGRMGAVYEVEHLQLRIRKPPRHARRFYAIISASCESRGEAEGPLTTSKRDKERVTTRT